MSLAVLLMAMAFLPTQAPAQESWDPNAIPFEGPTSWQQAAVSALIRHLPTDSGYFVLGPLDRTVNLPDTMDYVRTTLRIITPNPRASRNVIGHLWVPTGGVAMEELQPSDTLLIPHALPPGYSGRFLKGTIAGEYTLVQVFTVQEHRWLLWAQRAQVDGITEEVAGPIARYANAVTRYLAARDSGLTRPGPPRAGDYGLEPLFDFYATPPGPVIRDREGYERLLADNRAFTLDGVVTDVDGFVPSRSLINRLQEDADPVLYNNKDGEIELQHRYRNFDESGGVWSGFLVLNATTIIRLRPGRYIYIVDSYGVIRVASAPAVPISSSMTAALLAHGEPLRAAGELVIEVPATQSVRVTEINVMSEEYFFSNLSLSLYEDVEQRADRYVAAIGYVMRGLDLGRLPTEDILIRKY
jgi:hypothetical protein